MSKPSPYNPLAKGDKDIPKDMTIEVGNTCYLKGGSAMLTVAAVYENDLKVIWTAYNTGAPHTLVAPKACFHNFRR